MWQAELPRLGGAAVVKQLVDGPEADQRFAREVTALRLAAAAEPPVAPRLLGFDPDQRVLVLEYLENGRRVTTGWSGTRGRWLGCTLLGSLGLLVALGWLSALGLLGTLGLLGALGLVRAVGLVRALGWLVGCLAGGGRRTGM